jgi:hypothetical protein
VSTPYESATLLIRLYELRRDPMMREARNWYARSFNPASVEEMLQALGGPNSAHFRMVTSYWDMASSFVLHGAIDEQMFTDSNGEHLVVFAKVEPFLDEYRSKTGNPVYLASLEKLVMKSPNAKERLASLRACRSCGTVRRTLKLPIPNLKAPNVILCWELDLGSWELTRRDHEIDRRAARPRRCGRMYTFRACQ